MPPLLLEPFPRDAAQDEARRELSQEIYLQQRSMVHDFVEWAKRALADLLNRFDGANGGGQIGLLIIGLFVVALIALVLIRFGPMARTRKRQSDEAAQIAPSVGKGEHRRRADAYAAEGRFADAVRERLRGIIAALTDRDVLDDRLGRTATEVATDAGRVLPGAAGVLLEAADLFGAIWYGGRPATAASYARISEIDDQIAATRPGGGAAQPVPAGSWAIPGSGEHRSEP